MKTPITQEALAKYDHLHPLEALYMSWNVPGEQPLWHYQAKENLRSSMPLVARALDRISPDDVESLYD